MDIDSAIIKMLAIRDHFSEEIAQKLLRKGFSEKEIEEGIVRSQKLGYMNDQQLAERFIERQRRMGYASEVIRGKLFQKCKDPKLLSLVHEDRNEQKLSLEKLFMKRAGSLNLEDFKDRRRFFSYLARRGFSPSLILEVFQKHSSDNDLH